MERRTVKRNGRALFGGEKDDIGTENTYPWDIKDE